MVIPYQMVGPENIHKRNIQSEWVILKNIDVYSYTCMYVTTIHGKESTNFKENKGRYMVGLGVGK